MFEIWPLFPQMNPRLHLLKTSKTLNPTHHDGDGGYCGHRSVGHRFPGIVRGAGGRVSPSLLPSAQPAASLRVQVNTKALLFLTSPVLLFPRSHVSQYLIKNHQSSCIHYSLSNILFIPRFDYAVVLAVLEMKYPVLEAVISLSLLKL